MQRFIGTKTVLARPITRGEYNAYRGWIPPAGEDQSTQGYLVEYTDGGTPNDTRHAGYITWSPKEQFDNAYRERPLVPGLAPHQQRVVDEKAELDDKHAKLRAFFDTATFAGLEPGEQDRLRTQSDAMSVYSAILGQRIAAFTPAAEVSSLPADALSTPMSHQVEAALQRIASEAPGIAQRLISEREAAAAGRQESARKD
jgi:hypothetical protein